MAGSCTPLSHSVLHFFFPPITWIADKIPLHWAVFSCLWSHHFLLLNVFTSSPTSLCLANAYSSFNIQLKYHHLQENFPFIHPQTEVTKYPFSVNPKYLIHIFIIVLNPVEKFLCAICQPLSLCYQLFKRQDQSSLILFYF